ncbi:hypothetical protein SVIO_054310 [Streptomyces violaceusniger]|uniref:Uncharacterized protein n=1 Tax=Streptomyces violaceusniger TaxID=68280 RepID=A0A4D4L8I0_STRVO|nr:hypothetical protein SVIO_054310 [Streptomyces violaceusniger]
MAAPTSRKFLGRPSLPERTFVINALRTETVGGVILLVAAIVALVLANTPLSGVYGDIRDFSFGPRRCICVSRSLPGPPTAC